MTWPPDLLWCNWVSTRKEVHPHDKENVLQVFGLYMNSALRLIWWLENYALYAWVMTWVADVSVAGGMLRRLILWLFQGCVIVYAAGGQTRAKMEGKESKCMQANHNQRLTSCLWAPAAAMHRKKCPSLVSCNAYNAFSPSGSPDMCC